VEGAEGLTSPPTPKRPLLPFPQAAGRARRQKAMIRLGLDPRTFSV